MASICDASSGICQDLLTNYLRWRRSVTVLPWLCQGMVMQDIVLEGAGGPFGIKAYCNSIGLCLRGMIQNYDA